MSALGQKQTCAAQHAVSALPPIATAKADMPQMVMSALSPKADVCGAQAHVCFGPKAAIGAYSVAAVWEPIVIVFCRTSKMTAVDHPNNSAPFIAAIGPRSCQRSVTRRHSRVSRNSRMRNTRGFYQRAQRPQLRRTVTKQTPQEHAP